MRREAEGPKANSAQGLPCAQHTCPFCVLRCAPARRSLPAFCVMGHKGEGKGKAPQWASALTGGRPWLVWSPQNNLRVG